MTRVRCIVEAISLLQLLLKGSEGPCLVALIPGFLCPSRQVSYQNSPWLGKPQGVGFKGFLLLASISGDSPFARLLDRRGQGDFLEMLKTSIREASRGLHSLSKP